MLPPPVTGEFPGRGDFGPPGFFLAMPHYEVRKDDNLIVWASQAWGVQVVPMEIASESGLLAIQAFYFPRVQIDRIARLRFLNGFTHIDMLSGSEIFEDGVKIADTDYIYCCRESFRGKITISTLSLAQVVPRVDLRELGGIAAEVYRRQMTNLS